MGFILNGDFPVSGGFIKLNVNNYVSGLYKTTYSGYFNDNPAFFASASSTATEVDSTLAVPEISFPTITSYQYLGYFTPTTSETYTFYVTCDDAGYLWIGSNALSGFSISNATVNGGGEHGAREYSGTIALTAGTKYPIRIQVGNNGGPGFLATSFSTSTISKTSTFTGLVSYNPATNGF
jgi:hypothetical protein